MQIQSNLGSTIAMAFDECAPHPCTREYMENSVARTVRWLERCKAEMARLNSLPDTVNPHQLLFGINQGGTVEAVSYTHLDVYKRQVNATFSEVIEVFREVKYTRYPVYEETTDNVIGIINIKDLLLTENQKKFCIQMCIRDRLCRFRVTFGYGRRKNFAPSIMIYKSTGIPTGSNIRITGYSSAFPIKPEGTARPAYLYCAWCIS